MVLCLNAFAKLQNAMEGSSHPVLMFNCPTYNHMLWPYQSTECFVISPFQVVCRASDSAARREVPFEKKVDMKYMQVNGLRNIARMTKRGGDIQTD